MKRLALTSSMALAFFSISAAHAAGNGQLDPKFSSDGMATAAFDIGGDLNDTATSQVIGPGGSTYVVGWTPVDEDPKKSAIAIAKFQHDGKLDTTYGDGGRVIHVLPGSGPTSAGARAAMTADGKLLVATTTVISHLGMLDDAGMVCRFGKTGKIDTSFGDRATSGCARIKSPGPDGKITSKLTTVAVRPDGGILLGGQFIIPFGASRAGIASLTSEGKTLEDAFGENGFAFLPSDGPTLGIINRIDGLELTKDGGAIVLSKSGDLNELARVSLAKVDAKTGAPFAGFGDEGILKIELDTIADGDQRPTAFAIADDGSIFISGDTFADSADRAFVAKLSAFGELDPAFAQVGFVEFEPCPETCRHVTAVEALADGVVLAGQAKADDASAPWFAMKLNAKGVIDTDFGILGETTIPLDGSATSVGLQGRRVVVSGFGVGQQNQPADADFHIARLDHGLPSQFSVFPSAGANGSISPAVIVKVGHSDVAEFKVTPKFGFRVANVSGCGNGELVGSRYRTGPVTGACVVQATFEKVPFTP